MNDKIKRVINILQTAPNTNFVVRDCIELLQQVVEPENDLVLEEEPLSCWAAKEIMKGGIKLNNPYKQV